MTHNISVGHDPSGTAFDPRNHYVYVDSDGNLHNGTTGRGSAVDVLSTLNNSLVTEILIGGNIAARLLSGAWTQPPPPPPPPWEGIAYDDSNGEIYAASPNGQNVSVINGSSNTVVGTIPVAGIPVGLAYDGSNGDIYVTTFTVPSQRNVSNNVRVISGSTNRVIGNFSLRGEPVSEIFDPVNNDLYVSNDFSNTLTLVDAATHQVVSTLAVNSSEGIGYDPVTGNIYLGGYSPGNSTGMLTVVNSSTNTGIHVLWFAKYAPTGAAYDSQDQNMLATLSSTNGSSDSSLLVLSPRNYTEMGRIHVTGCPDGIWYDPGNDAAYLAVGCTNNVTVMNPNLVPYLSSVLVDPGNVTVEATAVRNFTAIPSCAAGACPIGIVYTWSTNNSLGSVSPALGSSTHFSAGNKPGEVTVEVTASLNGVNKSSWAHVTIFANPTRPSPKGSWYAPALRSLPTDLGLLLAGAGIIVLALLVFRIVRNRRSSHPSETDEGQKRPGPPKSVYPEKKSGK